MKQKNNRITPWACIASTAVLVGLTACGGGGGTTTTTTTGSDETVKGYTLPSEISAVPTENSTGSNAANLNKSFSGLLNSLSKAATAAGLPSTSDYATINARTFVEEPALEKFDIIEQVLTSLAQTNYAEEVGNGAYQAVISWEQESDGVDVKQLQTWTVISTMVDGNHPTTNTAQEVNKVQVWIPEIDPRDGSERMIKAQFDIYTSAEIAADGSFINYGEWDLNVYFDADPTGLDTASPQGFFAADARIDSDGITTLRIVDQGVRNEFQLIESMQGVLIRSQDTGYGSVTYPDWDACYQTTACDSLNPGDSFPSKSATYAYNATHLAVDADGNGSGQPVYKDRDLSGAIRIVHRYGLFYADADTANDIAEGENIEKKLAFGFPVRFMMAPINDPNGTPFENWGYYGAWQGRHELWGPEEGLVIDDGSNANPTTFTRADIPPDQTAPTYTLVEFGGTFTKRNLVAADLDDIKGVPVQTWVNDSSELFYINGAWRSCDDGWIDWSNYPSVECKDLDGSSKTTNVADNGFSEFTGMADLERTENDTRWISIGGEDKSDPNNPVYKEFMYVSSDPGNGFNYAGPGLYEAGFNQMGVPEPVSGTLLDPTKVSTLWVNVSGSLHIKYTGDFSNGATGWEEMSVESENPQTGQPVFGSTTRPFSPKQGDEYYINAAGNNYVVKRKDSPDSASSYDVQRELQSAANPVNTDSTNSASILPAGTSYLATAWNKDVKFTLVEDPTDPNYLLVVVKSDDTNNLTVGDVSESQWGLQAFDDNGTPNNTSDDTPLAIVNGVATNVTVDDYGWPVPNQPRPVEFNWEKPNTQSGQSWGKQRFLKDSAGNYVILSNPVSLNNVAVADSAGNAQGTLSLQFDGWMHGMPDVYGDLAQNNWEMTPDIASKVVYIPEGTVATGDDGTRYFVKPLDTSLFLGVVDVNTIPSGSVPSITSTDTSNMPSYTAHNMGATPSAVIKYTEGKPVE